MLDRPALSLKGCERRARRSEAPDGLLLAHEKTVDSEGMGGNPFAVNGL